jgi:hypothetical protein
MAYPAGRMISVMQPDNRRRRRPGRLSEGPWSIESASGGTRPYARHARSLSARNLRQRLIVLTLAAAAVAGITLLAVPGVVDIFSTKTSASLKASVAIRDEAAAWVAEWVSHGSVVACDPAMCAALHARGIKSAQLIALNPGAIDPMTSDVVVETPVVRAYFGSRLAQVYAPGLLASFGRGGSLVQVRAVVSSGAVARYRRGIRANLAARRSLGGALLRNRDISESEHVAALLRAGRADLRMLLLLSVLAHRMPITILAMGGAAPGAGGSMPLLSADITAGDLPAGNSAVSAGLARVATPPLLTWVMRVCRAQIPPLNPARWAELASPAGLSFVRFSYAAPTPLTATGMAP